MLELDADQGVHMGRRERQRDQILLALNRQQFARVVVLSSQHLTEFPDDVVVRAAADEAEARRRESKDGS
jgi:hypothetical protein